LCFVSSDPRSRGGEKIKIFGRLIRLQAGEQATDHAFLGDDERGDEQGASGVDANIHGLLVRFLDIYGIF
jgi:hypothetical protein